MKMTNRVLKPRKGGVNGESSWRKFAQLAQQQEETRRSQYGENVPDKKAAIDSAIELKTDEKLSGTITAENITNDLLILWGEL